MGQAEIGMAWVGSGWGSARLSFRLYFFIGPRPGPVFVGSENFGPEP